MAKEKWMQKAVDPENKGQFREKLIRAGLIPKDGKVTIKAAQKMKEIAQKQGDTKTVHQAQFAINAIKISRRRKK